MIRISGEATANGLGADGSRWHRLFGWTSNRFDALSDDVMGPLLRVRRMLFGRCIIR